MSKLINTLLFTSLIAIVSTSPIPSIPLVILNFKINGLFLGYLATLIGGLIASINQFFLSRNLILRFLHKRFPRKYIFIEKYSKIIYKMNSLEFILLLLSGAIPNSIISVAAGLANMRFKKFIICLIFVSIPQQFIFVIAASQLENVERILSVSGFDKFNSIIFTIGICSLIVFLLTYGLKIFSSFFTKNRKSNIV